MSYLQMSPRVSVVIPTRFRHVLLERAITSVLSQTFHDLEVVVVIDGPDLDTERFLENISDNRVKVIKLPCNKGASHARNKAIDHASGSWIAFLDDDDEWLPEKIETQIAIAREASIKNPIVACRLFVQSEGKCYISPRRLPGLEEDISDYLFVRKSLFRGEGSITTSMIMTTKSLLQKYPFGEDLKRHQEADWLLRVAKLKEVSLHFSDRSLGILHINSGYSRISETGDWLYSFTWAKERRALFTTKAYSAFLLTAVSSVAAREKSLSAFFLILKEYVNTGYFSFNQFRLFLAIWLVPQPLRRFIRVAWLSRQQPSV
ncbi:MAG: glycosyltransferase [Cyanobacteria bacterium J06560_6]